MPVFMFPLWSVKGAGGNSPIVLRRHKKNHVFPRNANTTVLIYVFGQNGNEGDPYGKNSLRCIVKHNVAIRRNEQRLREGAHFVFEFAHPSCIALYATKIRLLRKYAIYPV